MPATQSPEAQIAQDLQQVENYLKARLELDFPTFSGIQLGKFDGDEESFQGLFTVSDAEDNRIAYVFHAEPDGPLTITRA